MKAKKKKIGRPPMPKDKVRAKLIAFRVDEKNFNILKKCADKFDLTIGAYCESCALEQAWRQVGRD